MSSSNWKKWYFGWSLLLLGLTAGFISSEAMAEDANDDDADKPTLFDPDVTPRKVEIDDIDSENFEFGLFGGVISLEDFDSEAIYGVNVRYHISEDFFIDLNGAKSKAGKTSYERLSGAAEILTDDERDFLAYGLNFGFNLFPGEAFVARNYAFTSRFYLLGGLGSTDFAGDNHLTINIGFGYQVYPTDWLAFHFQAQDYLFDLDVLGEDKTTHNLALTSGLSVYF